MVDLYQANISTAQKRHLAKDQYKSDQANCLCAAPGSVGATGEYMRLWIAAGKLVNPRREQVAEMDIVKMFISANGARRGRVAPPLAYITKVVEVLGSRVQFLTDARCRRPEGGNPYNIGEQEVADLLRSLGYQENEEFNGLVCRWTKS